MNTTTSTTNNNASLMSQAHKAAKLAFAAQKADQSGDLLYSDFVGYYMKELAKPVVVAKPALAATPLLSLSVKETISYSIIAVVMILVGMLPNIELVNGLINNGLLSSDYKMISLVGLSVAFNLLIVGAVVMFNRMMESCYDSI